MKRLISPLILLLLTGACASTDGDGVKRNRMRDCPPGMIQVCETREHTPSQGGDEELPEYEYCRCESIYR